MSQGGLKKGILAVLAANLINLGFNLFLNFAQPKLLSVDSYAMIKSFQLYVSYVGILHLGYIDGMYLSYGGKTIEDVRRLNLSKSLSTLRCFQLFVQIICIVIAFILRSPVLLWVAISIFPYNIMSYYKSLYQATGEFKKYGKIMNATTISAFLLNFILLIIVKSDNYNIYLLLYVISYFVIAIFLEAHARKRNYIGTAKLFDFDLNFFKENIKKGVLLMLGNFTSTIFTSMDRWFIKALMDNSAFAYYSFAVSMDNFLNIAVTPVTITLYNYFCVNRRKEHLEQAKDYILLFAVSLPIAAFPAKFILDNFLQNYIASTQVMFLLFAAKIYFVIVQALYVNLYKAKSKQSFYFKKLVAVIVLGAVFNTVFFMVMHRMEAFALGTLLSGVAWLLLSMTDFDDVKLKLKDITYVLICTLCLLKFGAFSNSIIGFVMYAVVFLTATQLLYPKLLKSLIQMIIHTK